ncbi:MAG: FliM/FliN family flagellar motor C-terminal domain-containing protein [Bryobacter sp.]|jgi:flagellar motor switch protein FliN/FliY|nr:FliM/FliN family flagellar motor C-terminal domain-containing protein [Bryobacter sp. CoA8 C33]
MSLVKKFEPYLDMTLQVEAVLDEKTMTIYEILALEEGTVIKLNRSAGENIDLFVGGVQAAFAEVVIIDDSMGVRVTDLTAEAS